MLYFVCLSSFVIPPKKLRFKASNQFCPAMVRCGESPRNANVIALGHLRQGFLFLKNYVMTNEKLNLQPLQELLTSEVDLDSLVKHLDSIYYNFTEFSMKTSCFEGASIEQETIICRYWIARLRQVFEDLKN